MSAPPTNEEALSEPHPKFVIEGGNEGDEGHAFFHSRNTSGTHSNAESPTMTPRSLSFGAVTNPFSPPASVASFSSPEYTPGWSPASQSPQPHYPFPEIRPRSSGVNSVSTSIADLSRSSSSLNGNSRPGTADFAPPVRTSSGFRLRESFASPRTRPLTIYSTAQGSGTKVQRDRPKSTMLMSTTTLSKPWLQTRDPYTRIAYFITYGVMMIGVAAGAFRCWLGWNSVALLEGNLCPVLDENFDSSDGIFGDNGKFFREVDMSGFGNGEFEMTTASENNSFVQDGFLYISPTLTSDNIGGAAVVDGTVYNITGCTYNTTQGLSYTTATTQVVNTSQTFNIAEYNKACSAVSNSTSGKVINPVQSARLSTRYSASIKYGRVEVRAKNPTGDWLWPAIWMLPVNNTYGPWPLSGEIDIMEARGNGPSYPKQGSNYVRGSLNWGPLTWLNAVSKTYGWRVMHRGSYDQDFHTYTLEWDQSFIRIYVDSRLHHYLDLRMNEDFWKRGDFPAVVQNGSEAIILDNPWVNGTKAAPFDQSFYLILDVAVGGTSGWFPDGSEKPWLDGSATAMGDFWSARSQWSPSWPSDARDRAMVIDYVKMWQLC